MSESQDKVDAIAERAAPRVALARLRETLHKSLPQLQAALPRTMIADQFVRVLLTTVQSNPTIGQCAPQSIIRAAFEAAGLGLTIDGVLGHAYLVPYRDKRQGMIAQMMIGYRGFCELAYRSKLVARITSQVVYSNDEFRYREGTQPELHFVKRLSGERGERVAAFSLASWVDPAVPASFEVLSEADVEARRARSRAANIERGPWITDPDAMWQKSAIRALAKVLPQCPDVTRAALVDELRDTGAAPAAHIVGVGEYEQLGEASEGGSDAT